MSKLPIEDAKLFHKLMDSLLYYTNKKVNAIKNVNSKEEFFQNDIEKTVPLRKKIFANPQIIDDFVKENPENFNENELSTILSWKMQKSGEFFLAKHTRDFSLFYSSEDKKVYGVLGISDSFEEMFHGYAPAFVKITLLPFKGKIIYEGIFFPYTITFGSGMRRSLKLEVDEAIQKYGITDSFDSTPVEKKNSDEELLRFYMKSEDNRKRYWEEIEKLRKTSKDLEAIYHQEEGSISARDIRKSLRINGAKGHFAILCGTVVASGLTKEELEENTKKVVPDDKRSWIYNLKV